MKRSLIVACCLLLGANVASAQDASIGIFSDVGLGDCEVANPGPALITLYIAHYFTDGATESRWKFDISATLSSWIWLSDEVPVGMTIVGESPTGISVDYGSCRSGNFEILKIMYYAGNVNSLCQYVSVRPHPSANGDLDGVDCSGTPVRLGAEHLIINPTTTCQCMIPVQDTNWGQIKALYN